MKTMAKTVRDKLEGITSYWTFEHLSNASMEGFNNKIRLLNRMAHAFHGRDHIEEKTTSSRKSTAKTITGL